eukprot:TRINITY_DN11565_c0_g1_i1.p1 TRINITY_DN11565_c0_g1~~TRINITY_DN11565_c0_g1_i1.p1  ORF type:complete len:495 (-),score=140.93 TRINITY_DN11565_c0_g1_i1:1037-2521(-)
MNDFPNGHFKVGHGLNINTHSYQPPQITDPSSLYNPSVPYPHPYAPAHSAFAHPHPATRHIQQISQNTLQPQLQHAVAAQHQISPPRNKTLGVQQAHHSQLQQPRQHQHSGKSIDRYERGRTSPAEPQDLVKQKRKAEKIRRLYHQVRDKAVETDRHDKDDNNTGGYEEAASSADMFLEAKMEYESSVDEMEDNDTRNLDMKSEQTRKPCPECGKLLTNVREHVKSVHWQVKNYICDFCPYSTSFKADLAKHRKSRHRIAIRELESQLGVDSSSFNTFNFPKPQKRPVLPITQPKLNPDSPIGALVELNPTPSNSGNDGGHPFGMNSLPPGIRGGNEKPGKSYKDCEACGKQVINLNEHMRRVHRNMVREEKSFSCPECDYKTLFKADLNKHQSHVHQRIRKICNFCGKHVSNLSEHIRFVHKHDKRQKCDSCNYSCVKPSDLRKHITAVHKWSKGLLPITQDVSQLGVGGGGESTSDKGGGDGSSGGIKVEAR